MSETEHTHYDVSPSHYILLIVTTLVTLPGLYFGLTHVESAAWVGSLVFGLAIFGAAFILSWAAEAAQIDISESLAVAILALMAVLPEYAVDFVFTWEAAHDPSQAHLAIANMTGANRLLVGLGWPVVLFLYVFAKKRKEIVLHESQRVEIFYLAMATVYSFTIPLKGNLNLIDTVILVTLFGLYTRRAAQMETVEPELVGPVRVVANMSTSWRRIMTILLFLWAGAVIFVSAEPFAHSLVMMGEEFGINKFLLVQWLAPIASEAPEFIVAATWALRGHAGSALKALISSKVNQWTLLVGTIPLVFAISGGAIHPFPLDSLQQHELFLTAAQSLFAVAVLVNLRLHRSEGILLVVLFLAQMIIEQIRIEVAIAYLILAAGFHWYHRKALIPAMRMGLGLKSKN
ncbi:MAG TPA: sodium:calcium antiporter [candidate division Zixibacteria bacterium]|nr:sodium:calcium antiporter [candidate division Zixibacteria bacterium]